MTEHRRNRPRPGARPWVFGVLALALAGSAWGGIRWWGARRARAVVASARAEMEAGRFATARLLLLPLTGGGGAAPPEALYRLGVCEQALGRDDAAVDAWRRVGPGSPWFARAAVARATRFINTGRYRPAEEAVAAALDGVRRLDPADAYPVYRACSRLKRFEGQVAEVRATLRDSWWSADDAERPALLRELWFLDNSPLPVDSWQRALERADPNDDRVRLGLAAVDTWTGRFHEARGRIDSCLKARPDDPAVWRAALDLALASGDPSGVWRAAPRVPVRPDPIPGAAGSSPRKVSGPAEPLAVRAWLLERGDDREAERGAWLDLLAVDPGHAAAIDRLSALAVETGRRDEVERWHREKAALDRTKDRVRHLMLDPDTPAAAEQARLAASLGRGFDAWAWGQVAAGRHDPVPPAPGPPGPAPSLADRLVTLGLKPGAAPGSVAARPSGGGVVPSFTDDAPASGLAGFTFENGQTPFCRLPETMSGGVGVLDFDGDGWLDIYAVQGGPVIPEPGSGPVPNGDRLFRNQRDGTFRDVSDAAGIPTFSRDYGLGVTVGDYDNDGRPDLFVTRLRSYALYRNEGDGTFRDVTAAAGLAGVRDNPSSAAFADLDGDGDLDLYVCHYMRWDPDDPRLCKDNKGGYLYCDPSKVDPAPDHAFRNDGGRFVDVTAEAGFTDPDGRGLGVVAADFDGDGRLDLYVANDGTANFLFRNLGGFRFEEVGLTAGVAGGAEGGYQASMGVACGDYDGDGLADLVVTNFYGESSTLYRNLGGGLFLDQTSASGLGTATRYLLGFGTAFADVDDDGRPDLVTVNGHVNDSRPFYPYAMPSQLLMNRPGGRFVDVSGRAGEVWAVPRVARGLAVADLDNDGRLDALVLAQDGPLAYFHNRGPVAGRSVTFRLEGKGPGSNRDGVGARVEVAAGGRTQTAQRFGGGSYQSAGDPRLHFGLSGAAAVDSVSVRWPSGHTDRFTGLPAGTGYRLREGAASAEPLEGFARP